MKKGKFKNLLTVSVRTLFLESPGKMGVLVTKVSKNVRDQKWMEFRDGHAALDWCEKNKAVLVYLPAADLTGN